MARGIGAFKLGDFLWRQPLPVDLGVPCFVPVKAQMEQRIKAEGVTGILAAERGDLLKFSEIGFDGDVFQADLDVVIEEQLQTLLKGLEQLGFSGDGSKGGGADAVNRHLDVPRRIFFKEVDMVLGDQGGVGENGHQQTLAFEVEVDLGKILAQQGFAAGDQAPHRAQGDGLIDNGFDLVQGQFLALRLAVILGQVDITVPAVIVAAGGELKGKGKQAVALSLFFPELKIRQGLADGKGHRVGFCRRHKVW